MITVNVDDLFVSWLASQLPGVNVSSERLPKLEDNLPAVEIRRGSSGSERGLDLPLMDCRFYGATRTQAAALGRQVQVLFEEQTPTAWRGAQFTWLRCVQATIRATDERNQSVETYASRNLFSLQ